METVVLKRIRHDHNAVSENGMPAERNLAGAFFEVDAAP